MLAECACGRTPKQERFSGHLRMHPASRLRVQVAVSRPAAFVAVVEIDDYLVTARHQRLAALTARTCCRAVCHFAS